jgi:hypothetical protein
MLQKRLCSCHNGSRKYKKKTMKIGDKVRFLNAVGGGVVTGFQGKDIAIVCDENGFDLPTLIRECVVIDTDDYNIARPATSSQGEVSRKKSAVPQGPTAPLHAIEEDDADDADVDPSERPVAFRPRALERRGGELLNIFLAFVPMEGRSSEAARFEAYLVNDCNYTLHCTLLQHEGAACSLRHDVEVEANTKVFLEEFSRDELSVWERVTLQATAFKRDKSFSPKVPVNVGLRIDVTKFYKLHTFVDTPYFDVPALLCDVVRDDRPVRSVFVEAGELKDVLVTRGKAERPTVQPARKAGAVDPKAPIEVDLHAAELLETTAGMTSGDILEYQLKVFRDTMAEHAKHRGRKIVFIHGKGEGVLRAAILKELKTHYKQCRWQDASFREYGFGATQVTL